jgi:hypothetical protein
LVAALFADAYWRENVLNIAGIPDRPEVRQCVPLTTLPGQRGGDVDILAWARKKPEAATATEVKRIKVSANSFISGRPNKLQEYEKAVRQANRLAAIVMQAESLTRARLLNSMDLSRTRLHCAILIRA